MDDMTAETPHRPDDDPGPGDSAAAAEIERLMRLLAAETAAEDVPERLRLLAGQLQAALDARAKG